MEYKSSRASMLTAFFLWILVFSLLGCFPLAWLIIDPYTYEIPLSAPYAVLLALASIYLPYYLAYHHFNITVKVSDTGIKFFRKNNKEYLDFPFEFFTFGSYIVKSDINGIPTRAGRFLRVTPKFGGKQKNYMCHSFSSKTFEEFISYIKTVEIRAAQREWGGPASRKGSWIHPAPIIQEEDDADQFNIDEKKLPRWGTTEEVAFNSIKEEWPSQEEIDEVMLNIKKEQLPGRSTTEGAVFNINKAELLRRGKKPFSVLIILFCVSLVILLARIFIVGKLLYDGFFDSFLMIAAPFAAMGVLALSFFSIKSAAMLSKVKNNTPEAITLFPDRLVIDDRAFCFSEIKQIKLPPPVFKLEKTKLAIIEEYKKHTFIIGDPRDMQPYYSKKARIKVFDDYVGFCDMLEEALVNEPGKLVWDLERE